MNDECNETIMKGQWENNCFEQNIHVLNKRLFLVLLIILQCSIATDVSSQHKVFGE